MNRTLQKTLLSLLVIVVVTATRVLAAAAPGPDTQPVKVAAKTATKAAATTATTAARATTASTASTTTTTTSKAANRSAKAPAKKYEKAPKIEVTLDTSESPEMADWAAQVKKLCEKNYAMIVKHLGDKGYEPPAKTTIVFKRMEGVAYTSGGTITCSTQYFTENPGDSGAVIHELCHVVQRYQSEQPPSWVTEGIADYVRWFNFEPEDRRPRIHHIDRANYTDSYQTTAAFFHWIEKRKAPGFVRKLNAACRKGKYSPELFKEYAEKPVDDLWKEFAKSQQK